ncbi:MAG: bacteriohemerythrin [Spirochaetales bacterium]|jgi:hemerythrin|nr:bacteriohemerythrin [Spirochaetales bacterium]
MQNNKVAWSDAFSVGSKLIDDQHKGLVQMTNDLFTGCERRDETVSFMKAIQSAVSYAKVHFATEERFMQKTNYPDYALHKKEHEDFVQMVLKQVKNFEDGNCAPIDFALFLKNWLLNHIAVSDKKYSPYLTNIKDAEFAPPK